MPVDGSEHEPDEPEEYDPEAEFRDPDSDSLTIPDIDAEPESEPESLEQTVRVPEVSTAETDVPADLAETFWALVLVINVAVFALALGALFLLFEENATYGGWLIAGGFVLVAFAVRRYRAYDADTSDSPLEDDTSVDAPDDVDSSDVDP